MAVLNDKKLAFWVFIVSTIACIVAVLCFMKGSKNRYYEIKISVPAGTEINTVRYADEEVCPRGNTLKLEMDDFYGGTLILQAADGGSDVMEQTVQMRSDTSVIFQVQPGVWYWVGLRIELNTGDNEGALKVRVSNAEVRAALETEDILKDSVAKDRNSPDIKRPEVNLSATEGAEMTEILYADKDKIIFSGYYGLFVYSKKQRTITNAIDLESIGCNYTQGDNACEKFVSADGNIVYLHPMNHSDMFIYNIETDNLSREQYHLEGYDLHTVSVEKSYNRGDCDTWRTGDHVYLTLLHHGEMLGELSYADVSRDVDSVNIQWYPLFSPEGLTGAVDFSPEDIHDIASADIWVAGELLHMPGVFDLPEDGSCRLHCEDPDVLKELENILSKTAKEKAQTDCPFFTALYLTRNDGIIGTIFPATDSCDTYNSGTACYKMADGSNEQLWNLINGFQKTEAAENMGVDYTFEDGNYVVEEDIIFQYKVELTGRTSGAGYDTRYIVLTNDPDITFEQVDRRLNSSVSADRLSDTVIIGMQRIDENTNIVLPNPIGLTMNTENVSSKGCTLVFNQSGGNVTGELQTGEAFFIQIYNGNGEWENIGTSNLFAWNAVAVNITSGSRTEIKINWEFAYGELGTGHYRIRKEVMDFRKTADYDTYDIYTEFDIGD